MIEIYRSPAKLIKTLAVLIVILGGLAAAFWFVPFIGGMQSFIVPVVRYGFPLVLLFIVATTVDREIIHRKPVFKADAVGAFANDQLIPWSEFKSIVICTVGGVRFLMLNLRSPPTHPVLLEDGGLGVLDNLLPVSLEEIVAQLKAFPATSRVQFLDVPEDDQIVPRAIMKHIQAMQV